MKDSLLALGSVQNGICLLNLKTDEAEVISTGNGLQNKTVLSMMFDEAGHLWLGLDNGIDCIHLNARVASLYGGQVCYRFKVMRRVIIVTFLFGNQS